MITGSGESDHFGLALDANRDVTTIGYEAPKAVLGHKKLLLGRHVERVLIACAGKKSWFDALSPTPTSLSHGSNTALSRAIRNSCGRRAADLSAAQG